MSIKALSDYTQYARYARYLKEKKRRETWTEQVDRVFEMHEQHLGDKINAFKEDFFFAKEMVKKKKVLGSQRALQFGGSPILEKNAKIYNCTVSYVDRVDFFKECMYLLLCGCGVGFSVQTHHVEKLPKMVKRDQGSELFVVPDSIEGWSDAIGVLMQSYFKDNRDFTTYDYDLKYESFSGKKVEFDFSAIREEGAHISWGGKAPGPKGLENAIKNIEKVFEKALENGQKRLRAIDAYDIIMHTSDAVLSGGIRRSATICLFSPDDHEMATAKTGSWFIDNPQRGRSNNSALLIRNETTKEQFAELMKSVKEFGEPGFVWADSKEVLFNPCCEIGMYAYDENGESGFEFCNLCEINGKKATSEEEFLEMCKAASILGTIQASYDSFDYLSKSSEDIVRREALLGVSMTGMMDNPHITFDPEIQKKGAKLILKVNEDIAKKIGINKCARATCVKPAGCLDANTIIRTSGGNKTLLDIFEEQGYSYNEIKDLSDAWLELKTPINIFNENDELENVSKLYVNGKIQTFEIPLEDGSVVRATPWHKFKLTNGNWKRADELEEGDDILTFEDGTYLR
jgi:ribonucleoside-triphosphate reductase